MAMGTPSPWGHLEHVEDTSMGMGTPPQEHVEHMEDISVGMGTPPLRTLAWPCGHHHPGDMWSLGRTSEWGWGHHNPRGPGGPHHGDMAPPLQEHLKHREDVGMGTPVHWGHLEHTEDDNVDTTTLRAAGGHGDRDTTTLGPRGAHGGHEDTHQPRGI